MDETAKSLARPAASRSLHEAIRKARLDEAERLDRTADRRESEIGKLELLKTELEGIMAEVPRHDDRFSLALVPSKPARLWIDLFSYVTAEDPAGGYQFVRNSENGRRTLFSTSEAVTMAGWITDYVAREIVRRERQEAALLEPNRSEYSAPPPRQMQRPGVVIAAFVVGLITGACALFVGLWLSMPPAP